MRYQFNKTFFLRLEKDLNLRLKALPILKAKENALRQEVKKAQHKLAALEEELTLLDQSIDRFVELWAEYPDLISISKVGLKESSIAGIRILDLQEIKFQIVKAGLFHQRPWVIEGTELLKKRLELVLEKNLWQKNLALLEKARRTTTQKANLYEKVQVPQLRLALRRIKGYLEDVENLSRTAQKIVKKRRNA